MNQQHTYSGSGNSESRSGRGGWTGLVNSMISFTNAATMFSIQQMQNSFSLFTDSRKMLDRFKNALDSLSHAMNIEVDDTKRSTVDQMNRTGSRMVNATVDTFSSSGYERGGGSERASGSAGYDRGNSSLEPEEALTGRKR